MIEKHYGKYLRGDLGEQFSRLLGAKTETFTETLAEATGTDGDEVLENSREEGRWAHLDLNQGPTGYEPVALTKLSYGPVGDFGFAILRFHSGQVLDFGLKEVFRFLRFLQPLTP